MGGLPMSEPKIETTPETPLTLEARFEKAQREADRLAGGMDPVTGIWHGPPPSVFCSWQVHFVYRWSRRE